jgi:hypothetical protein
MKSPQITSGRQEKATAGWLRGVNSVRNPWNLPADQIKWAVNATVRGGIIQTRPGQAMRLSLPPGNLQGGCFFSANKQYTAASVTTTSGGTSTTAATIYNYDGTASLASELPYLVFAVGGSVYFAPFPLTQPPNWEDYKLSGIQLDPNAPEVVFAVTSQTATRSAGGDVTVTPNNNLLVVQDGVSSAGYWDGSDTTGGQSTTVPIGYWMAFSGNRLWVANGNIVFASDLGDPLGWTERTQGAGRGDFSFPRPVTGMVDYVGQNNDTRLVVFTDRVTYSLASGVLDRSLWASTSNFQNTLFPTVGCVAGKSTAFQAGLLWWYSQGGLVNANVAAAAYLSSQVLFKDTEMVRVKRLTPADLTGVCAAAFENYLLVSVPYREVLPSATMVLDYAPASELGIQQPSPAWSGVWTGTRPIEWAQGIVDRQPRLFHFSVDYVATNDGSYNHVWESFQPERVDSYLLINQDGTTTTKFSRIYSQMETGMMGDGLDLKQLKFAELECSQLGGTVDVRVSYRGSRGAYQQILQQRLLAVTDEYQYQATPLNDQISGLGLLRTQYRKLVTEEVQRQFTGSCENKNSPDIDKAFGFLVEWCGEFGVEAIRCFLDPFAEKAQGKPQGDETVPCVVAEDGTAQPIDLALTPYDQPDYNQQTWFATATETVSSACSPGSSSFNVSATATATAQSFVSYANAQEQASVLASQAAQAAVTKYRTQNPC